MFRDSKVHSKRYTGDAEAEAFGAVPGTVQLVFSTLRGEDFMDINGGPMFTSSPAISFFAGCDSQEEVDHLWDALAEGGSPQPCGWVTDKFGVTWQIVPEVLVEMLNDQDPARAKRVLHAMLLMTKLEIAVLTRAYERT